MPEPLGTPRSLERNVLVGLRLRGGVNGSISQSPQATAREAPAVPRTIWLRSGGRDEVSASPLEAAAECRQFASYGLEFLPRACEDLPI